MYFLAILVCCFGCVHKNSALIRALLTIVGTTSFERCLVNVNIIISISFYEELPCTRNPHELLSVMSVIVMLSVTLRWPCECSETVADLLWHFV